MTACDLYNRSSFGYRLVQPTPPLVIKPTSKDGNSILLPDYSGSRQATCLAAFTTRKSNLRETFGTMKANLHSGLGDGAPEVYAAKASKVIEIDLMMDICIVVLTRSVGIGNLVVRVLYSSGAR